MGVVTLEGADINHPIIEHGQIRLKTDINLPEKTKVYVMVSVEMQVIHQ